MTETFLLLRRVHGGLPRDPFECNKIETSPGVVRYLQYMMKLLFKYTMNTISCFWLWLLGLGVYDMGSSFS